MGTKLYYVQECICDQCKRTTLLKDDEGAVEGKLPKGWVELAARVWPEGTRGNETLFALLCPKCYRNLPFSFYNAFEET